MKALALDLGGSGGKIILGEFNGKRIEVKEIHRFPNLPLERDNHYYWDFDSIYSNLLVSISKSASENITSFGVDSFCNDYGLLDASHKLVAPIFTYRDSRTNGVMEWMDTLFSARELYERTGCQRARFNTLVQLASLKKASDPILEKTKTLLFIPDLINFRFSSVSRAEFTIASVSQVYNRHDAKWDDRILQAFSIPAGIFQEVIPSAKKLGNARQEILDLTGSKPFSIHTVGHHDTACAVAAVPSTLPHFAYISSGTWSLIGTETSEMITSDLAFTLNFANEGGVGGRNRLLKNIMGLWLLQECQRQFASMGIDRDFSQMEKEAELATPFRSLIDPDDPTFFEPGDMISKVQDKCKKTGQPIPESVGEITRCILESLAFAYRDTLEKLELVCGWEFPVLHVIGGGARNELLNKFTACAIHRPVLAGPFEATGIGNLCTQFMAAGELAGLDEARQVIKNSFTLREFHPENTAAWNENFERFNQVRNLKS